MIERLKAWAGALKLDCLVLWLAARDPRVGIGVKLLAASVAAYAFSPIDLIPDFIPVLGLLDDLLLVPAGIWLALRLLDPRLVAELRRQADGQQWPRSMAGAIVIVGLWALGLAAFGWWLAGRAQNLV